MLISLTAFLPILTQRSLVLWVMGSTCLRLKGRRVYVISAWESHYPLECLDSEHVKAQICRVSLVLDYSKTCGIILWQIPPTCAHVTYTSLGAIAAQLPTSMTSCKPCAILLCCRGLNEDICRSLADNLTAPFYLKISQTRYAFYFLF